MSLQTQKCVLSLQKFKVNHSTDTVKGLCMSKGKHRGCKKRRMVIGHR